MEEIRGVGGHKGHEVLQKLLKEYSIAAYFSSITNSPEFSSTKTSVCEGPLPDS